jgi:ATP-binding cassette subfamily B protein
MGRVLSEAGKAVVALGRLREILEEPQEAARARAAVPSVRLRGDIRFGEVGFAYAAGEPVLRGLSFHVQSGETVALLGPPGSGKSTVVQLILRLYEHDSGSIRLDGREIGELGRETLRAQVGVVLQEPFLYSKSILDNLELGRPDSTLDELVACTRDAAVHETIQGFPDGYYTLLGERGLTLSGGQRQRVAIARALLKDAPILLLDDALSAVDTRTEATILAALRRRRGRRTTLLVTHRLSAIPLVDRILVFEEGRVVQDGTHPELFAEPGPYRRLWEIQDALEESLRDELQEITA